MRNTLTKAALILLTLFLNTIDVVAESEICANDDRVCRLGFCDITGCLKCDKYNAICTSSNPREIIPSRLNANTTFMTITYTGPPVELNNSTFSHFHNLRKLTMIGRNITALSPRTFFNQPHLNSVNFTLSSISQLPSILFDSPNEVRDVSFLFGKFSHFPVNIFPNIPNVVDMEFSYNPLDNCQHNKLSIEKDFQNLTRLETLRINGFGTSHDDCQDISSDYLEPLSHVKNIYLSESNIFSAGPNILAPLKSLKHLIIDKLPLFQNCPSQASELFRSLPQSLASLTLRYWTTSNSANESCFLNHSSLLGLKMLPNLAALDTRNGEKIFSNTLTRDIFNGFHKLKALSIGWCGISWIKDGTFDSLPRLKNLDLDGNLLGPRKLMLFSKNITSNIATMNLIHIGINSAIPYDLTSLLDSFPKLTYLYLNSNLLQGIPMFFNQNYSSNYNSTNINVIKLNSNYITTFTHDESQRFCSVMPHLVELSMEYNKLADVTGVSVCSKIIYLSFAYNHLGQKPTANFQAISQLSLKHLDLTDNQLTYIPNYLFDNMPELSILLLAQNAITALPNNLPPGIIILNMNSNDLSTFDAFDVKELSSLISLYIQDNSITSLSNKTLESLENDFKKLTLFAFNKNPFVCPCDTYFKDWLHESSITMLTKDVTCSPPSPVTSIAGILVTVVW